MRPSAMVIKQNSNGRTGRSESALPANLTMKRRLKTVLPIQQAGTIVRRGSPAIKVPGANRKKDVFASIVEGRLTPLGDSFFLGIRVNEGVVERISTPLPISSPLFRMGSHSKWGAIFKCAHQLVAHCKRVYALLRFFAFPCLCMRYAPLYPKTIGADIGIFEAHPSHGDDSFTYPLVWNRREL